MREHFFFFFELLPAEAKHPRTAFLLACALLHGIAHLDFGAIFSPVIETF